MAVAQLLQGQVVAQQGHLVGQGHQRGAALRHYGMQQPGEALHQQRGLVRLLQGEGVERVEGVEQEVRVNLGPQQLQLGARVGLGQPGEVARLAQPLPEYVQAGRHPRREQQRHVRARGVHHVIVGKRGGLAIVRWYKNIIPVRKREGQPQPQPRGQQSRETPPLFQPGQHPVEQRVRGEQQRRQ